MPRWLKVAISAFANGLIGFFGGVLISLNELEPGEPLSAVNQVSIVIAAVTGLSTALKELRAAIVNSKSGPIR